MPRERKRINPLTNAPGEPLKRKEIKGLYHRLFNILNSRYFNNELPDIIIEYPESDYLNLDIREDISNSDLVAAFLPPQEGIPNPCIILDVMQPAQSGVNIDTIENLHHELIHYFCFIQGIKDTGQAGVYHNMEFKRAAESHGAECSYIDDISGYNSKLPQTDLDYIFAKI